MPVSLDLDRVEYIVFPSLPLLLLLLLPAENAGLKANLPPDTVAWSGAKTMVAPAAVCLSSLLRFCRTLQHITKQHSNTTSPPTAAAIGIHEAKDDEESFSSSDTIVVVGMGCPMLLSAPLPWLLVLSFVVGNRVAWGSSAVAVSLPVVLLVLVLELEEVASTTGVGDEDTPGSKDEESASIGFVLLLLVTAPSSPSGGRVTKLVNVLTALEAGLLMELVEVDVMSIVLLVLLVVDEMVVDVTLVKDDEVDVVDLVVDDVDIDVVEKEELLVVLVVGKARV